MITRRGYRTPVTLIRFESSRRKEELSRRTVKARAAGMSLEERLTGGKLFANATIKCEFFNGGSLVPTVDPARIEAEIDGRRYAVVSASVNALVRTTLETIILSEKP